MFQPYLKILATVVFVLGGAAGLAREPATEVSKEKSASSEFAIKPSPLVRSHMRRVQAWFAETNDSMFYRLAFVATVTEIRAFRSTDKLIGELADGETGVVVLQVRAMSGRADVPFQRASMIVCPVGKLRTLWERWHTARLEMLFEYNRIGKVEFVQKFGC